MYEIVYVLTVESTIFGLFGVMLVAQRWDVFSSTQDAAWPVLSSSVLLILAYSQLLLVLCCAIGVGQFGSLTYSLMDACARTAGRLVTCCVLCVCYICALLLISEHKNEQSMQCLLMQLFATSCTAEGVRQFGGLTGVILHNVLWSFQTYFAVLVPLFLLVAGLQITAAGLCKDERRKSRARLLCVNIPYILTYYINYMLLKNIRCKQACKGATISEKADLIFCKEILFLTGALYVSDIVAETVLVRHTVIELHGARGKGQLLDQYLTMRISGVFVFGLLRIAQVLCIIMFNWFAEASLQLPSQLVLVHVILASVLAFLDIVQVVLEYAHPHKNSVELLENNDTKREDVLKTKTDITVARNHTPFEVDTKHRKLLTFTGRSRWPAMLNANAEIKDRKSS
jgi:hypothetical protein